MKAAEGPANGIVPTWTPPPHTVPQCSNVGNPPHGYLRLCPLQDNTYAKTKKYGPNERTDQNSKNRTDKEIANLSDAEFKTPVIRMLTEMIQFSCKMKEEMKATESEIKKNIQGTNSEGKETGTQINSVDQKEERNIQPERMKKQEFGKMRRGLGTSGTS